MKLWVEDFTSAALAHAVGATLNDHFPELVPCVVGIVPIPHLRVVQVVFRVPDELYAKLKQMRNQGGRLQDAHGVSLSGGADGTAFSLDTKP